YADAVMTSHIVNRKLDKSGKPGTLSADILTGILRNQLHFEGVVFTDDMQMQAITKNFGLEEAIKLAIKGGVDIMTFSNNLQDSEERIVDIAHTIIKKMVADGEITSARIDQSYRRIIKLKMKLVANENTAQYEQRIGTLESTLQKLTDESKAYEQRIQELEKAPVQAPTEKKSKRKRKK
ncbi:MAG TPA: glycoside hydrolase family 3 N-terminal domain-containing protein, partial [Chryseolinea sp.]|nr:glycoside hydrolase family 3 N-terminal domain-containing protein [Chryseolinea sp.]